MGLHRPRQARPVGRADTLGWAAPYPTAAACLAAGRAQLCDHTEGVPPAVALPCSAPPLFAPTLQFWLQAVCSRGGAPPGGPAPLPLRSRKHCVKTKSIVDRKIKNQCLRCPTYRAAARPLFHPVMPAVPDFGTAWLKPTQPVYPICSSALDPNPVAAAYQPPNGPRCFFSAPSHFFWYIPYSPNAHIHQSIHLSSNSDQHRGFL